ncbi:MAG: ABC transporter transmembrane domain-containing protein, partial [Candidatus Hodarchaeales archaeon]
MSELVPTVTKTPAGFWKWFIGHLSANKLVILIVVLGTACIIFIRGLIPIVLGHALDAAVIDSLDILTNEEQLELLQNYVLTILILGIVQFVVSVITTIANEWLAWSAQRRIREEFFNSMQNKPLKFHDS